MTTTFTTKQPAEAFAISFDFANVLGDETIVSAVISAVDQASGYDVSQVILDSSRQVEAPRLVYGWVRSGTSGHNYLITCIVEGSSGSVFELEAILPVVEVPLQVVLIPGVASFNPETFKARYPEFASAPTMSLSACFDEAGIYLSNTAASPVRDLGRRMVLLNMLTAHIAFLGGLLSADGMPRPVGRVSQASEGSVSASFEGAPPGSAAWFQQTAYGASFWQATSSLRGFRYFSRPTTF